MPRRRRGPKDAQAERPATPYLPGGTLDPQEWKIACTAVNVLVLVGSEPWFVEARPAGGTVVHPRWTPAVARTPARSLLLVASVNAVGGSVLRDLLCREVPLLFRPGEFYALAALGGAAAFLFLARVAHVPDVAAALAGIAITFLLRVASLKLGWRAASLEDKPPAAGSWWAFACGHAPNRAGRPPTDRVTLGA